mmetsp:Transcript_40435/g.127246  ORF Transcript_40435/g.127246 Transcript_40435/m.127246 type:complete len:210 (+) Transcript_40435:2933-3562(+)
MDLLDLLALRLYVYQLLLVVLQLRLHQLDSSFVQRQLTDGNLKGNQHVHHLAVRVQLNGLSAHCLPGSCRHVHYDLSQRPHLLLPLQQLLEAQVIRGRVCKAVEGEVNLRESVVDEDGGGGSHELEQVRRPLLERQLSHLRLHCVCQPVQLERQGRRQLRAAACVEEEVNVHRLQVAVVRLQQVELLTEAEGRDDVLSLRQDEHLLPVP